MKILQRTLLALVAGSLLSVSVQAATGYGQSGQPYVGVKAGKFLIDEDVLDDLTAYGVYAGYNFTPNWGAEIEYVGSSDEEINLGATNLEYNLKSYGAYGTYRYQFPNTALYAKGKLGITKIEVEASVSGFSGADDDTGLALGLGLGYLVNPNVAIEGEYAVIAEDTSLLTIGANYKF